MGNINSTRYTRCDGKGVCVDVANQSAVEFYKMTTSRLGVAQLLLVSRISKVVYQNKMIPFSSIRC